MSRCVILSACPVSPALAAALRPDDTIIACDAGYRNCEPLGCRPDIIVGDFDTAPCPAQEGDDTIILPHVKDDTDTEYAAKLASEKGFDEALLLGVLGGRRLEHTLANLCTGLGLEQRGVRAPPLPEGRILLPLRLPDGGQGRGRLGARLVLRADGRRPHRRLPPRRQQRVCRGLRLHHHLHPKGRAGGGGDGAGWPDPELRVTFCAPPAYNGIENERKVVGAMQVVVLKSPKCLRGLLRRLFGIKKETQD